MVAATRSKPSAACLYPSAATTDWQQELVDAIKGKGFRAVLRRHSKDQEKQLRGLLLSRLPTHWVIDTMFAEMMKDVRHLEVEAALKKYLAARMDEDRALLGELGVLNVEKWAESGRSFGNAWALLRAADLLRARQAVLEAVLVGAEGERTRTAFAAECEHQARTQLTAAPFSAKQTLMMLAFTRGLTDPELEDARTILYAEGELARTRQMMAKTGLITEQPAVFIDFAELEAIDENPNLAQDIGGFHNRVTNVVALNRAIGLELMLAERARGSHSKSLVHELVHTLQDVAVDAEGALSLGPEDVLRAMLGGRSLYRALSEGATDNEALFLLPKYMKEEAGYLDERMFVQALAELCSHSPEGARDFTRELATAGNHKLPRLAAARLLGVGNEVALEQLAAAYYRFSESASEMYTETEVIEVARACLLELRDGPRPTGDELRVWAHTDVLKIDWVALFMGSR